MCELLDYSKRWTNGIFYVALGSSMSLALMVWKGGGLLKQVLYFFGNEPSSGRNSPILRLPQKVQVTNKEFICAAAPSI